MSIICDTCHRQFLSPQEFNNHGLYIADRRESRYLYGSETHVCLKKVMLGNWLLHTVIPFPNWTKERTIEAMLVTPATRCPWPQAVNDMNPAEGVKCNICAVIYPDMNSYYSHTQEATDDFRMLTPDCQFGRVCPMVLNVGFDSHPNQNAGPRQRSQATPAPPPPFQSQSRSLNIKIEDVIRNSLVATLPSMARYPLDRLIDQVAKMCDLREEIERKIVEEEREIQRLDKEILIEQRRLNGTNGSTRQPFAEI